MALIHLPTVRKTPADSAAPGPDEKENESRQRVAFRQLKKSVGQQRRGQKKKQGGTTAAPEDTVACLDYLAMYDDGICCVRPGLYSITLQVSDINYQAARLDEKRSLYAQYGQILNSIDPMLHVQLSVLNRNLDQRQFQERMLLPEEGEGVLQEYRIELNQILADKALEGQNGIMREKYITITTEAADYTAAKAALARLETDFTSHFRNLGCEVMPLSGLQRLELIQRHTRPDAPFLFDYDQLLESNLTTKHAVAPMVLDFSARNTFRVDGRYGEVLILRDLPARLTDDLITRLTDLPFEMTITVHIDRLDQTKAREHVQQQIAFMEMEQADQQSKAYQKGYDPNLATPMEQRRRFAGAKQLLGELSDQCMFQMTFLIYVGGEDLEQLNDRVLQVCSVCAQKSCAPEPLRERQKEGFNSTLPLGFNSVDIRRTMHTRSLALFIPFTTQELFQPHGIYYGLNAMSRNLIFFSRYALKAPSGWVLGTPGGGKSMAVKVEMINVLLSDPNAEVIVIDPEREYPPLCEAFHGECIRVSAGSKHFLNPMDLTEDYADDDAPMLLKTEFILSLVDIVCGGGSGLTPGEKSVVSRACAKCYKPFFANPQKNAPPTLKDFYEVLIQQTEPEAKQIALALELYINGALDVFAHRTNVNPNNRFVVYDVKDLGKELRTLGMLVVLDQVWNRITRNRVRKVRTWLYIDEIQLLFSNDYCAQYFAELWSRARKWGAIPTGITQNVENLLVSEQARTMLSNSDFVMMLNQAQPDRKQLAQLLNISNRQLSFITNAEPGHGLLVAGKAIVPFAGDFPADTKLYQLMTTRPGEEGQI